MREKINGGDSKNKEVILMSIDERIAALHSGKYTTYDIQTLDKSINAFMGWLQKVQCCVCFIIPILSFHVGIHSKVLYHSRCHLETGRTV